MSKARRIPDIERTVTMLDLLHDRYPSKNGGRSHVVIEEVAPGTGYRGTPRYADVLVLGVWPSCGLNLEGYEVKASRADLKKELADLTKHQAVARYCTTWSLVAWDESVLVDGIPDDWGIYLTVEGDCGRELKLHRRPAVRTPDDWPRDFVCSLVRNAFEQAPRAAHVARVATEANRRGRLDGERLARADALTAIRPLQEALYHPAPSWKWPAHANDVGAVAKLAAERLTQLPLASVA